MRFQNSVPDYSWLSAYGYIGYSPLSFADAWPATPQIITCGLAFIRVSHDLRIDDVVHLIYSIQRDRPVTNYMIHASTPERYITILPLYTRFFWGRLSGHNCATRNCSTTRTYILYSDIYYGFSPSHCLDENRKLTNGFAVPLISTNTYNDASQLAE